MQPMEVVVLVSTVKSYTMLNIEVDEELYFPVHIDPKEVAHVPFNVGTVKYITK